MLSIKSPTSGACPSASVREACSLSPPLFELAMPPLHRASHNMYGKEEDEQVVAHAGWEGAGKTSVKQEEVNIRRRVRKHSIEPSRNRTNLKPKT